MGINKEKKNYLEYLHLEYKYLEYLMDFWLIQTDKKNTWSIKSLRVK